MINSVALTGRLTKDVELRYSPSGKAIANGTLAVDRMKDGTDFIRIVAFSKTAETMANHLGKGSLIGIEGRIQTGSYEKNGQRVYTTDVIVNQLTFLEKKHEREQVNRSFNNEQTNTYKTAGGQEIDLNDDELPF